MPDGSGGWAASERYPRGRMQPADKGAARYAYDAFGHRVEKITPAGTFYYVHDLAGRPITELSSTGGFNRGEVYADGGHLATYANSTTYFDYSDWLGTTRMTATLAGLEQSACISWPYGAGLNCSASAPSPMHFTGQVHDATTGLDHFPARYYNSAWGGWLTPDPQGLSVVQSGGQALLNHEANPQDWNMYAYALGNPTTLSDPTGLNACSPKDASQTDCKVTIVVADRTKDKNGNYNDQFTGVKNQKNYNATAKVYTSYKGAKAQLQGTFLIKTTPSSDKYATIRAGTYKGRLTYHHGNRSYPDILLTGPGMPHGESPALGGRDPLTGKGYATGIEIHRAGWDNYTGVPVSEGCSVVCTDQYPGFEMASGLTAPAPQRVFTVLLETSANGGAQ